MAIEITSPEHWKALAGKILTRAVVADHQYLQIENRPGTVWGRRA